MEASGLRATCDVRRATWQAPDRIRRLAAAVEQEALETDRVYGEGDMCVRGLAQVAGAAGHGRVGGEAAGGLHVHECLGGCADHGRVEGDGHGDRVGAGGAALAGEHRPARGDGETVTEEGTD